ncbi:MAG TPA: hypothetical protein VM925_37315, partial [Labilithrix sp.]|nr:hypothetical protein [Labilithrix sp.]
VALLGTSAIGFGAGASSKSVFPALALVGMAGYGSAAPIVHWSHGQVGRGFASLGLRLAAPLFATGAYFGTRGVIQAARGGSCLTWDYDVSEDHCVIPSLTVALSIGVVGVVGVMIFDALVLAKEPVPQPSPTASSRLLRSLSPSLQLGEDRATLTIGGALF